MTLFSTFSRKAPNIVFLSIVLGAFAGISYALLIPIVISSLQPADERFANAESHVQTFVGFEVANFEIATLFFFVCVFILFARSFSQIMLIRVAMDVATDFRINIYNRVAATPIADLERMGSAKLVATLATDVQQIVAGARIFPDLLVNLVTLLGMLGFLFYLSADVFWFVLGAVLFGVLTYQIPMLFGHRYLVGARQHLDELHESIQGLIYGAKELKLNHKKRQGFFDNILLRTEFAFLRTSKRASTIVRAAANYGDLLSFFVIGVVTFVFVNYRAITTQELVGVVMALLYITGPLAALLGVVPQIAVAKVSFRKINQVLSALPMEQISQTITEVPDWTRLRFQGVTYEYEGASKADSFRVGPIDLEIRRGEITLIIGGNGSGKSTLSKLISLHYHPRAGEIFFDGVRVTADNLASYRQEIAAIYTDFYLFDRLLGLDGKVDQKLIDEYLHDLDLQRKVKVSDGRFSTLSLSDGQRKRLALLVTFLEDRNLYLFDEWAADQDPVFKDVYYEKILPRLKARNKAVVAISHDSRYFDIADRLLVMEDGQLISHDRPAIAAAVP